MFTSHCTMTVHLTANLYLSYQSGIPWPKPQNHRQLLLCKIFQNPTRYLSGDSQEPVMQTDM